MKITKNTLKQIIKEEISAVFETGMPNVSSNVFTDHGLDKHGLDEQAFLMWANDRPEADPQVPYTRVLVDEPIEDPGSGLKLVFNILPEV